MTIDTLLDICERYDALGSAVQEQLRDVLDNSDTLGDQNPNAVARFMDFLKDTRRQLHSHDDRELHSNIKNLIDTIEERLR